MLTIIPSGLVIQGLPLSITPATLVALFLTLCCLCAHITQTLGMAKGRNPVRTAVSLFALSLVASYAYGNYSYLESDEVNQADRTLVIVVALVGVTLLICDGVRTRERIDTLLRTVTVAVAIVCLIGALQFIAKIDLTRYLVLPGLKDSSVVIGQVDDRSGFSRVQSTTSSPIEFGVLCAMILPLPLHYAYRARTEGTTAWGWYLSSALIASGLLFSVSRSAVLGVGAAGIVLITSWSMRRRLTALLVAGGFLAVSKVAFPGLLSTFIGLFQNISSDSSVSYRTQRYPIAAQEISKDLWFGRGVGTWYFPKHFALDNQYIMTLIESGIIGFSVLVGLYLTGIVTALRTALLSHTQRDRDLAMTLMASASVPVVGSVTFDLLSFRTLEGLLFVVIGVIGAFCRIIRSEAAPSSPPAHTRRVELERAHG
ncbi:O-antigen ligase family protein [Pseudonocardia sp. 73-21]|uniref:O-antigen ligase family protein n=1 Tax=Pseudonocardia sp. 73-21 TaxID=1895809 RepID=UPI00260ACC65|nr:O-antigen ligase family protein [Pseudonocardia sp. 73-21]